MELVGYQVGLALELVQGQLAVVVAEPAGSALALAVVALVSQV